MFERLIPFFLLALIPFGVDARSDTLPDSLSQKPLVVAIYNSQPFGTIEDGHAEGLMVELWERVASRLGYEYAYHLADMETLLEGVNEGRYDVGIGAITITPAREQLVDFSHAIIPSGTGIVLGAESMRTSWKRKWRPILGSLLELMGVLALIMFGMGSIIWVIERKHGNPSFRDDVNGLADGFWWAAVTMSTVGYGDKVPKTPLGKLLTIFYILISVVAVALFTAHASSILTTAEIHYKVNEEEDLRKMHVGSVPYSSGAEYLERNLIAYKPFESLDAAIAGLESEEVEAVVYNMPTLRYLHHQGRSDLLVSNKYLQKNYMGFAFTPGSKQEEEVNRVLLAILGEVEWQHTVNKYLGSD